MNVEANTKLVWMTAAEVAFLRAEGALRGWNMGGTAESFYKKGVELSFSQWGASGADAYLEDGSSLPDLYILWVLIVITVLSRLLRLSMIIAPSLKQIWNV